MQKIAILFQAKPPPLKNGVVKPMKEGGYSDSGADIAYALSKNGYNVVTPVINPHPNRDKDWVFPDTKQGIEQALSQGATTVWLNTVLYNKHPIESFYNRDIRIVGQDPVLVDMYDDKFKTNDLLKKNGLSIPMTQLISSSDLNDYTLNIEFPMVIKPVRGRGSQGVAMVTDKKELDEKLIDLFKQNIYGDTVYIEKYLKGQEITVTVMPAGKYRINNEEKVYDEPWSLPVVKRFNHHNGIVPYSGVIAVVGNSSVLSDQEQSSFAMKEVCRQCEQAAKLINIKAPIRVDCRADEYGNYFLFDTNMKPNMTGPSRPHRQNQDSLSLLAARKIGWNYEDLLSNILNQSWDATFNLSINNI